MSRLKKLKYHEYYTYTLDRVKKMQETGRYFYMRSLASPSDARVNVAGREMIMFGSNNYLGLSTHPKVIEAAQAAVKKYGAGTGGSRISSGTMDLHEELERELAKLKGCEEAALFNCGYLTNLGVISAIADRETIIFNDKKNHASLIDGSLLSGAHNAYFEHNDPADLERLLQKNAGFGRKIIAVDGIFSMDGDLAKLPELRELARKYTADLVVDDAHSTGIFGKGGGGTAEHFDLVGKIRYEVGTLSKALGGAGGFLAGSKEDIFYIKHASRQFIFSTALPPPSTAAALAAVKLIKEEPWRRETLLKHAKFLREELKRLGYNIGLSESHIIPVIIGDEFKTYELVYRLEQEGIYVLPAAYPVVRRKDSRIRMSLLATHMPEDLDGTLTCFNKHGKELGII